MIADELEHFAQSHRVGGVGKFRRRADRQVDQEMGRTGRELFDMIEATICSRVSRLSGRSTEIRMSSAGDRLTCPPQTRQPRQAATTSFISSMPTSTGSALPWCQRFRPVR